MKAPSMESMLAAIDCNASNIVPIRAIGAQSNASGAAVSKEPALSPEEVCLCFVCSILIVN